MEGVVGLTQGTVPGGETCKASLPAVRRVPALGGVCRPASLGRLADDPGGARRATRVPDHPQAPSWVLSCRLTHEEHACVSDGASSLCLRLARNPLKGLKAFPSAGGRSLTAKARGEERRVWDGRGSRPLRPSLLFSSCSVRVRGDSRRLSTRQMLFGLRRVLGTPFSPGFPEVLTARCFVGSNLRGVEPARGPFVLKAEALRS